MQVNREGVANPRQQQLVSRLIERGLLRLDPDLRPCSNRFRELISSRESELKEKLASWEHVSGAGSWRYARRVFVVSVGAVALFVVVTQPGLQSSLVGIGAGLTAVLGAGTKLRDVVVPWFSRGNADA